MRDFGKLMNGKVAIVTGAASGIGEAVAEIYCEYGGKVLGVDIDEARLHQVADGSRTTKRLPCGSFGSSAIEPPIASTIWRQM